MYKFYYFRLVLQWWKFLFDFEWNFYRLLRIVLLFDVLSWKNLHLNSSAIFRADLSRWSFSSKSAEFFNKMSIAYLLFWATASINGVNPEIPVKSYKIGRLQPTNIILDVYVSPLVDQIKHNSTMISNDCIMKWCTTTMIACIQHFLIIAFRLLSFFDRTFLK